MSKEFEWSVTQNLGYRICSAFRGFPKIIENRKEQKLRIIGDLLLGSDEFPTKAVAKCSFDIDCNWPTTRPTVTCREPWIKNSLEWHVLDNVLCWEQELCWKDRIQKAIDEGTIGNAAEFAKIWMIRSVRNLLNRHLFAHRTGSTHWQKQWDFWAHYEAGADQYRKSIESINEQK